MNMIKVNKGTFESDVFYGDIRINGKSVIVSNFLKSKTDEYEFRWITKCRAGFQIIAEAKGTVGSLIYNLGKHCGGVEVKVGDNWFHILSIKGGKWVNVDKGILETLTVSDMHRAFSKMIDWNMWKQLNTKTHASMAFMMNAA